jgi:hypothetical protein
MENQELNISIISPSDVKFKRDMIEQICDGSCISK